MNEIFCPHCSSSNLIDEADGESINCVSCEQIISTQKSEISGQSQRITVSTGSPYWEYEVVDAIFALDSHSEGFFQSSNPALAFNGVKEKLRQQARVLRGDAVVDCQFEYRVAVDRGLFGPNQAIEIFGYGTVIRRIIRQ